MIKRQYVETPNRLSESYVVHDYRLTLRQRFESRRQVGPYVCTRRDATGDTMMMYHGDDMVTGDTLMYLRLTWAHDVESARHGAISKGWYTDDDCRETVCGIVARLPKNRGFLAGYSAGAGMYMSLGRTIYVDEISAAYAADSMAENAAEKEREYQRIEYARVAIDERLEDIRVYRKRYSALAVEYRAARELCDQFPVVCRTIQDKLASIRSDISTSIHEIKKQREEIALYS